MRVLAARFLDRAAAIRLFEQLRAAYDLGPGDADIAPFHELDDGAGDGSTLLAGRFREDRINAIHDAIRRAGGIVVADVDEGWTQPHQLATSALEDPPPQESRRTRPELSQRPRLARQH